MNAASLAAFNARKAVLHAALWPAVVTFTKTGVTEYTVAFGETENNGQLQDAGQGIQHHRIGVLHFPVIAGFAPTLTQTFKVKSGSQAALAGLTYRVERVMSAPGESVIKCYCSRIEG